MKIINSLHGLFQDSFGDFSDPEQVVARGAPLDGGNKRVFFAVMAAGSLLSTLFFASLHWLAGSASQALLNSLVFLALSAVVWWAVSTGTYRRPMRIVTTVMVTLLSIQTLRQGQGLHGAGWWLSVLPFMLAAGGFHHQALGSLAAFFGVVLVIYVAPSMNPMAESSVAVHPTHQMLAILSSEALAIALIVLSMRRRARIAKALDRSRGAALDDAAVKTRFLANMSHEIRTPLLGLIGSIELMRSSSTSPSQRQQLESLAESSARTLHSLINDVLDFSKLESGKLQLERAPINLRDVCFQVNELFAVRAFDKGLELTSTCDLDVPQRLVGDSVRIRQMVSNLVSNAVKFTSKGGVHIHLGLGRRPGGVPEPVDQDSTVIWVRIDVSDTGIGISDSQLSRLFRPFAQADSSITRRFGGTGLGLSITSELVRAMGGAVNVDSAPGQGSTFTIRIPLALHGSSEARTGKSQPKTRGSKVFVVSPSIGLQRHLGGLLTELGRPSKCSTKCPRIEDLGEVKTLVLDAASLAASSDLARDVANYTRAGLHVVLVQPLGSDAAIGLFDKGADVSIVHKPVRLSVLRKALEPQCHQEAPQAREIIAPVEAATGHQSIDPQLSNLRILVAEDNAVNQVVITAMLAQIGASCTMVSNGVEAVEAFRTRPFDIVLMDLQMPEMGGLEAARAIRAFEAASPADGDRPVPILAMTANLEREEQSERRAAGMSGYLGKPFLSSDIRRSLQTWCLEVVDSERMVL